MRKVREGLIFFQKRLFLFQVYLHSIDAGSTLLGVWPYLRVLSPTLMGYFVFGSILETQSSKGSFAIWFLSGINIWFLVCYLFDFGKKIFSSSASRSRLLIPQINYRTHFASSFLIYLHLSCASFILLNFLLFESIKLLLFRFLIFLIFLIIIREILYALTFFVGVLMVLFRDIRYLLPLVQQYLLLTSYIFFEYWNPNSKVEVFARSINPLSPVISEYRDLIFEPNLNFGFLLPLALLAFACRIGLKFIFFSTLATIENYVGKNGSKDVEGDD